MKSYELFKETVKERLKYVLPAEFRKGTIRIDHVEKVGEVYESIGVKLEHVPAMVRVNLSDCYRKYQQGETIASIVEMIKDAANKTTVPVALHLDHGGSLEQIYRAIRDGFTSVMIDASTSTFEENIELTKKVCAIAHPLNVSVEAELGTIGSTNGDREGGTDTIIYTNPDDAVKFVEASGCDCLAIAIGTAHGIYPKGFVPHLRLDLLEEIKSKVSIPLVLHGGSANPDEEIAGAVKRGVNKINISSDIKAAFFKEARKVLEDQGLREPLDIFPACIDAMNETVVHNIRLFESNNKTQYYKF